MHPSVRHLSHNKTFEKGDDSESWKAISEPLLPVCVICTGLAYGLGLGPVLFALLGEVLPPKIKGLACALVLTTR